MDRQHLPLLNMDYLRSSPAKFVTLKEKFLELGNNSSSFLSQEKQRHFEALNLSARKNKSRTLEVVGNTQPPLARSLFPYATLGSPINHIVKDKIQENVKSIREVLDAFPSPRSFGKRKLSSYIINENRGNYEAVDLDVDLCCNSLDDEELVVSKKLRMSV